MKFAVLFLCQLLLLGPQNLAAADEACISNGIDSHINLVKFGCNLEQMTSECQLWFKENPDSIQYARNCGQPSDEKSDLLKFSQICGEAIGEAWASLWIDLVRSIKKNSDFYNACENDPLLLCKQQLAKESFFQYKNLDELRDTSTLDLLRKRENVQALSLRDPKYRQRLLDSGVPLAEPQDGFARLPLAAILAAANAKLDELGIKASCYNGVGHLRMACYAIASVVDPTLVAGTVGIKGGRWAAKILTSSKAENAAIRSETAIANSIESSVTLQSNASKIAKAQRALEAAQQEKALPRQAYEKARDALVAGQKGSMLSKEAEERLTKEIENSLADLAKVQEREIAAKKDLGFARAEKSRLSRQPDLAELEEYLSSNGRFDGHVLTYNSDSPVLSIGTLRRDQKKFMVLAMKAIQEGSVKEIQGNLIVGPKALTTLDNLAKDAVKNGRELKIEGRFSTDTIMKNFKAQKESPDNTGANKWSIKEEADFQEALQSLQLEKCPHSMCNFTVKIKDRRMSVEYSEGR